MIQPLDLTHHELAEQALLIQKLAYRIEADLISFDGIPPLHETIEDLQANSETFVGYFVDGVLVGVISYAIDGQTLDIGRLVVHPQYFRRGIAQSLVAHIETVDPTVQRLSVSTGALNTPARTFYEKQGYSHIGDVTLPEGVTLSQYEKNLTR